MPYSPPAPSSPRPSTDPPVLLLVEDDRAQRLLVRHVAQKEGFRVVEVINAEQCLRLFPEAKPDLVLMDAVMPVMDGFTCCEELQKLPNGNHVPVLMVTSLNDQASIDRAFAAGATDYITKPIHWAVLRQRLHRLVQGYRTMQALRHQNEQERLLIQHIQKLNEELELKVQERTAQLDAKIKELEQLDELKDDFLCTVSHELRTPLSNIKIALQMLSTLLQSGYGTERQQDIQARVDRYLKILKEELAREITLVNDLLDLQRLEAGIDLEPREHLDLLAWLPGVIEPFYNRTQEHGQTLSLKVEANIPALETHPTTLSHVIVELLQNACKYTPPSEKIILTARANARQVQLVLTNTGVEIPASEIGHLFDKFYRVPNGDPWKHGGTGLGLALVKKRVEMMGGAVKVKSAHLQTSFYIGLPI